jgi:double zinc ribbon protein
MPEACGKCGETNSSDRQFCVRCHAPLRYTCPACAHVQKLGGACEACGVDFVKYSAMKLAAMQMDLEHARRKTRSRTALLKSLVLAPLTGGLSLVSYIRGRRRGD